MSTGAPWRPVLAGEPRAAAEAAITELAQALSDPAAPNPAYGAGLIYGDAGVALFHGYLALARPHQGHADTACRLLERAFARLGESTLTPEEAASFTAGFTGVAWVAEHLRQVVPGLDLEVDPEVDDLVVELLRSPPDWTNHDWLTGVVGYGIYCLERLPAPGAVHGLELAVAWLARAAEGQPEGACWRTAAAAMSPAERGDWPAGRLDLGPAHGTSGVIAMLAATAAAGVASHLARPLAEAAWDWLLAQRVHGGEAVFPPYVGSSPTDRCGWCQGDGGIAAVLAMAADGLGDDARRQQAHALGAGAAARDPERSGAHDASLCHGSAALAQLFARLHHSSGDSRLRDVARRWAARLVDRREPGLGLGGYRFVDGLTRREVADPGLLYGGAGIGLALLAATSAVPPAWDRLLLLSRRGP
jgi:lantibiotic modifying enzyme